MTKRRKLAAGNWKMNGLWANLKEVATLLERHTTPDCDVLLCPPATLLSRMSDMTVDGAVMTGGQDCHAAGNGAHTGDVAASMLADAGADYVIVGHSERRADHGESDADVAAKAAAGLATGLTVIICVGETLAEREADRALNIIGGQLAGSIPPGVSADNMVIAYEPVWAIGTGKIPTLEQIGEMHDFIRATLTRQLGADISEATRLLYGGSVKAANATDIFAVANVDGALVGGASLKADDFSPIIDALQAST
jgi:triosephosphate isomerase (TIM)